MTGPAHFDWGEASEGFDEIRDFVSGKDLSGANEAQTRFDVIDRFIRNVLGWNSGQVSVEERLSGTEEGYIDYLLRSGDYSIVVEAKRSGAAFPPPTRRTKLKLGGAVLGSGEIALAIEQATQYARDKDADVVVVTNGSCWCAFSAGQVETKGPATLLFPFSLQDHGERLFDLLSVRRVEAGSLESLTDKPTVTENRLITTSKEIDGRIDRNKVADFIIPALDNALYADALLSDIDSLEKCFVRTDNRTKYDNQLEIHLAETRPKTVKQSERIQRDKSPDKLGKLVQTSISSHAPPVTLIVGAVGVGKSTYLKHFELISGRETLHSKKAHWIYIDFEKMGRGGSPRKFMYSALREYISGEHPDNPTDWKTAVEPAYETEFQSLARTVYAILYTTDKTQFRLKCQEVIERDYLDVEPYVDKVLGFISRQQLCIIVLDNVDLYEDSSLETSVFSEGLALSKRIHCNVIVSLRNTTYARHRTDATFNAFELRTLWLEPPPFEAVLSRRLNYSKKILEGRSGSVTIRDMRVSISDLAGFFDVVQRSVLQGTSGQFMELMCDSNIRKGLTLITNFLKSGHIEADKAITKYMTNEPFDFPFHEVFKGSVLGQWRHFREDRAECVNLFDARLGSRRLQLLRLHTLIYLSEQARNADTVEVAVRDCIRLFRGYGASDDQFISCIRFLNQRGLVQSMTADEIQMDSVIAVTRSGGYQSKILCRKLVYVEECAFDTAITDNFSWKALRTLTESIEQERNRILKLELRRERTSLFLDYLASIENELLGSQPPIDFSPQIESIKKSVARQYQTAINRAKKFYS